MTYRLSAHERIDQAIARVVHEQIDRAEEELTDDDLGIHKRVHQVRKRFKKIRGVLRLVRFSLEDVYKEENTYYRDLGRRLSEVRDATALIETCDELHETYDDYFVSDAFDSVRTALIERRRAMTEDGEALEVLLQAVLADLYEARQRVALWPLSSDDFSELGPGLEKTYRRGRNRFKDAHNDPTPERLHEWRKRVKYHWYHVRLLQAVWPRLMKGYRRSLKALSTFLGDHHDLTVFRRTLLDSPEVFGEARELQVLLGVIERRQDELEAKAETLGQRIFFEKPTHLHDRFNTYWDAWRKETRQSALLVLSE